MNRDQLKNLIAPFYPALVLDAVMSRRKRQMVRKILTTLLVLFVALNFLIFFSAKISSVSPDLVGISSTFQNYNQTTLGLLFTILAFWLVSFSLEAFYRSYYFRGIKTMLPEMGLIEDNPPVTFEAASIIYSMLAGNDYTYAFVQSTLGKLVLSRSNIGRAQLKKYFDNPSRSISQKDFALSVETGGKPIGLADIALALIAFDSDFASFLNTAQVYPKDFSGAAGWVERTEIYFRQEERFWGKDILGRIPGIGKDWAFGGAYRLERFSSDITKNISTSLALIGERTDELKELEAVLSRSGESNALLVGEEGSGVLDIIYALGRKISDGTVLPQLEHKHIYLFDANAFMAFCKDKPKFETELLHMLNGALSAGNAIWVIRDLASFIETSRNLGSDLMSLLDPFLSSPALQVIAVVSPDLFQERFLNDSKVTHHFEKITVKDVSAEAIMRVLMQTALLLEAKKKIFFTYQSLVAVAESAKRYIVEGVASERAAHLLTEVVPTLLAKKKSIVEPSDILALIEAKTGIKTGEVGADEREKLLKLESILHERIIGQNEAVKAIAGAMRRARSDIENPQRPMSSFLFLGPTGVGKTETAKALAAAFFGKEESIIRFDMSEYSTDDALSRLIGSFDGGKAGTLASSLRENPYGVLLLDEFEKTSKEVLDLFLQVLDEGFFSDVKGKRVNARNLIIIATSNAGSDLIWKMLRGTDTEQSGTNSEKALNKEVIINEIIKRGIFKPELLNRFDGVILFHPLKTEEIRVIAKLMLGKLKSRLAEKGIELVLNDILIDTVAKAGTDPEFGGRPIARAIQEKVEQVVAQKMLKGEARAGSRIELKEEDLV